MIIHIKKALQNVWIVSLLIFVFSLFIRIARLNIEGLWGDEIAQISLSMAGPEMPGIYYEAKAAVGRSTMQAQPPFTYLLIRWTNQFVQILTEPTLLTYRLPSIIIGSLLSVAGFLFLYLNNIPIFWSTLASLFISLDYWFVGQSLQARPYIAVSLFSFLTWWILIRHEFNWRKYLPVFLMGIFTNIFYAAAFTAAFGVQFLTDIIKHKAINKSALGFFAIILVSTPYYWFLIHRQGEFGYYKPTDVSFIVQLKDSIVEGILMLPRILDCSIDFWNYTFVVIPILLCSVVAFIFDRIVRIHTLLLLIASATISIFLVRGHISWFGTNYLTSLRSGELFLFFLAICTLFKKGGIWLRLAQGSIFCLLSYSIYNLNQNWNVSRFEDWRPAIRWITNLPEDIEVRYDPEWLKQNNEGFIVKLDHLKPRPEYGNHDKVCVSSQAASTKTKNWFTHYDFGNVYVWCNFKNGKL